MCCVLCCFCTIVTQVLEGLHQMCIVSQKEAGFTEARRDAVSAVSQ